MAESSATRQAVKDMLDDVVACVQAEVGNRLVGKMAQAIAMREFYGRYGPDGATDGHEPQDSHRLDYCPFNGFRVQEIENLRNAHDRWNTAVQRFRDTAPRTMGWFGAAEEMGISEAALLVSIDRMLSGSVSANQLDRRLDEPGEERTRHHVDLEGTVLGIGSSWSGSVESD